MTAVAAARVEVEVDAALFHRFAIEQGWSDGLPLVPPTDRLVEQMLAATPRPADEVLGSLPPKLGVATIELVAVNAVMAGCEPAAFRYVLAAIEAILQPDFDAFKMTTSTSPACPMLIVNGPSRDAVGIDYRAGCLGGAGGRGSATIGRAVALCLRNIGGQKAGETSRTTFGQPARLGLCFGEWEERSPWSSLAQRSGFGADEDVVTVHGGTSTMHMFDSDNDAPRDRIAAIGRSLAYALNQQFHSAWWTAQLLVVINPIWARQMSAEFATVESLQEHIWANAWQPIDMWPAQNQQLLAKRGRVDQASRVRLVDRPDQIVPVVAGGLGGLHAMFMNSFGDTLMQSRVVESS